VILAGDSQGVHAWILASFVSEDRCCSSSQSVSGLMKYALPHQSARAEDGGSGLYSLYSNAV